MSCEEICYPFLNCDVLYFQKLEKSIYEIYIIVKVLFMDNYVISKEVIY